MPACNAAKTISESISSIQAQDYSNWELIVINDGSVDRTPEIVENFLNADKRIKVIHQDNQGIARAENNGLKAVKGEYIAFLDSDDLWEKDKLAKQVNCFEKNNNEKLGLVYGNIKIFCQDASKAKFFKYVEPVGVKDNFLRLLVYDYIPKLTVMLKTKVLAEVGVFDENLFGTEDWDLWIRIAKKFDIFYIDEPLGSYRSHKSAMTKNRKRHSTEEFKVIRKHVLEAGGIPKEIIQKSLWVHYKKTMYSNLAAVNFADVLISYVNMLKTDFWNIHNFIFPFSGVGHFLRKANY